MLGNGKYPQKITVTGEDGKRYGDVVTLWDNETSSLLIQINHASAEVLTVEVDWSTSFVATTPEYIIGELSVSTNSDNQDAQFLFEDYGTATRSFRYCEFNGTLTYKIDRSAYAGAYADLEVFYNYIIEVSNDNGRPGPRRMITGMLVQNTD